jgi:hypothetical protein
VISNLSTKAQQQDLFAVTKGAVATNLVQVYRSLGGGWEMRADEDPVQLLAPEDIEELQKRTKFWKKSLPASY